MSFSVIIPVYNEEEILERNIKRLINLLDKRKEKYEILVIDNGSTDKTYEIGKKLEEKFRGKVRFFHIPKKGVGLAFKKAVENALFEKLISVDVDLTIDLNFIPECLKLLEENSIVIGSKKVGKDSRSIVRKFISDTFIFMTRCLLRLKFSDYSIGAKGYIKSDIVNYLNYVDRGSFYVIPLTYFVKRKGKNIKEIPVVCFDKRKSRFNLLHEIFYRFKNLIIFWLKVKCLKSIR